MRAVSPAGLELVKAFEGLRLTTYTDVGGLLTIGYGHTGPEVKAGMTITEAEAEAILKRDLARFEADVSRLVKTEIHQNQFDALVVFAFNVGSQALASSTLLAKVNEGKAGEAVAEFGRWVKVKGTPVAGLANRRKAEAELFARA